MDTLIQDLRYAWRSLRTSPGFAAVTILCLALGIGVNSAIFSVLDAMVIRPLPFRDPDRIVALGSVRVQNAADFDDVSYRDLQDWRQRTRTFETMAAVSSRRLAVSDRGEAEFLQGALATWDLFPMLGVDPVIGRHFQPDDDRPGAAPVVMLSNGLWRRRYGADPAIVGRAIVVEGQQTTVVGVMPPRFLFPERAELWVPLTPFTYKDARASRDLGVFGRLNHGVAEAAARKDLASVADALAGEYLENKGWSATLHGMREELIPQDVRLIVLTMMGAVTFILLIACGNVANLLLARASVRQREIAVRSALGAGRRRIVRQLLTESVLVAVASVPLGIGIAYVGLRWLSASIPPGDVPYYINWDMNARDVVYTCVIAVITGVVFGLAPALQATRSGMQESLKEGGRGASGSRTRLRSALVVGEIALSLVVLVGASLFVRTFHNFETARAGIPTAGLMTMRFYMPGDPYAKADAIVRRAQDIVRRVEALPGVVCALASRMVPYAGGGGGGRAVPEGASMTNEEAPSVMYFGVTPHFLRTLDQPLLAGRDFTDAECERRSQVAIVNQVFANKLWPKQTDVIGRRFRFTTDAAGEWITVIGLIGDFRLFTVRDGKPSPYAFMALPYDSPRAIGLTVRVAGIPPASITPSVRRQIIESDSTIAIFDERTGDAARAETYFEYRIYGWMFAIFGVVALLLAAVGVYSVLSYSVSQRTQEIGVRMALGASRPIVFRLVVGDGLRLALIGIVGGLAAAFGVTRVLKSVLYNVSPTDPISFLATATFLTLIALAASYLPARRATSVDPMIALRAE